MGFGYKIMYDEVAPGTKPFDEANKIIFAVGPLTGAGAPCSSRVNITSLSTFTRGNLVVDAHMGGFFAAYMKYAGYNAIIIEGKAAKPVWINIQDDTVSIENAAVLWGKGTRATTEEICRAANVEACVAAIGPAGEKYTVKMGGCHACPIRCSAQLKVPQASEYGVPTTGGIPVSPKPRIARCSRTAPKILRKKARVRSSPILSH